ncbi:hypothetical protein B566_EDAN010560 [Ephemera danica]|nr:hypothetical protein B566_EDAN010560 [Ephemera danica]
MMGKLLLIVLAVTLVATFINGDEVLNIGGRDYFIGSSGMGVPWHTASERCRIANMQLISFETQEKWELIRSTLMATEHRWLNFWTSGARVDGTWMWTGRAHEIKFFAWGTSEPDAGENCLEMHGFDSEFWHSYPCTTESHYMCEYPVCCDLGPPASPDPLLN